MPPPPDTATIKGDDGVRARAIHGVKWAALSNWGGQLIGFVLLLVLARLLDPAEFGLFTMASAVVMLLAAVAQQGLSQALIQRETVDRSQMDTAFWTVTLIGLGLAGLIWGAAGSIARLLGTPELARLLPWLASVLPLYAIAGIFNLPFVRALDFRVGAVISLVSSTIAGIAAVALALAGYGVAALAVQAILAAMLSVLIFAAVSPYRPGLAFSRTSLAELWRFGASIMGANLLGQANRRISVLLVGGLLGPQATGLFGVARRIVDFAQTAVNNSLGQVAMPAFSRIQTDVERTRVAYINAVQLLASLTLPFFALVALLAEELTAALLGAQWAEAAPLLRLFAFGAMLNSVSNLAPAVIVARGKPALRLVPPLVSMAMTVTALALAWPYGVVAVATALVAKEAIMAVLHVWLIKRVLPVDARDYARAYLPLIASSFVAVLLAHLARGAWPLAPVGTVLVAGSIGGLAYAAMLWLAARALALRLLDYAAELVPPLARWLQPLQARAG